MSIRWDEFVTSLDGKPFKDTMGGETQKDLTVRAAVVHALFFNYADDKADGRKKFERATLGMRIYEGSGDEPAITAEEVAQCKELTAKLYSPLIIFRLWTALDEGLRPRVVPKSIPDEQLA